MFLVETENTYNGFDVSSFSACDDGSPSFGLFLDVCEIKTLAEVEVPSTEGRRGWRAVERQAEQETAEGHRCQLDTEKEARNRNMLLT